MHAPEYRRVEMRMKLIKRPVVRGASHGGSHDGNDLVCQRGIHDIFCLDEEEALAHFQCQTFTVALPFGDISDHPLQRAVGSRPIRWVPGGDEPSYPLNGP